MRNGNEKEIDSLNLLKHLLHSGTEEEIESDKDSYLAASCGVAFACQILSVRYVIVGPC